MTEYVFPLKLRHMAKFSRMISITRRSHEK